MLALRIWCSVSPPADGCTHRTNCPESRLFLSRYQDYQAGDIPVVADGGVTVRVMAGEYSGATGPIALRNPGMLLDVILSPGATFTQSVRLTASYTVCLTQRPHVV